MNVVLIVPGGVDRSGRERVIPALLWLIERLARRHRVLVVATDQEAAYTSYSLRGAQVVNLGRADAGLPGHGLWQRYRRLCAVLERPDVVHAFWIGTTSTLALMAAQQFRRPLVVSVGGGELTWLPQIAYGGLGTRRGRVQAALALRGATAVTAGSDSVLRSFAAQRPDARHVPLGVDTAAFAAAAPRPEGPPWQLLHVASINRVKNPYALLAALRLVVDREPEVRLDWVGEDTLGGEVQRRAAETGLADHVRFYGALPIDALPAFYQRAHLYVQASWHESQGVSLCEAAAAGVPAVSTSVGTAADLAPGAAWTVGPDDAAGLAAGIVTLLRDRGRRLRMGATAQDWARTYSADWTAATFEALYRQVLGLRRHPAAAGDASSDMTNGGFPYDRT